MTPRTSDTQFPLGPALDFLQRLWQLNHALERLSSRMEKRLGVTAQQRLAIRCIGTHPGLTPGQLAALLHVDPGTVSATLKRLERRGLLSRRRDRSDQRRVSLGLTAKGRTLDRPAEGTVERAVEGLLDTCPPREIAAMTKVLERLTLLLGAQLQDEAPARSRASTSKRSSIER